jgi:hypothetical protein
VRAVTEGRSWPAASLFRAHPCWISPQWALEYLARDRADAAEWMRLAREARLDSLLFVTKQHDGQCLFRTRFDAPTIGQDFLGEICAAAGAAGIKIMAYYSAGIDSAQAERHPDWEFQDAEGRPFPFLGFRAVCLNSPYREFALGQIAEILANYPVDGLWLDILRIGRHDQDCLCTYCRRTFAEAHDGLSLVDAANSATSHRWRVQCINRFLAEAVALARRLRPGIPVTFNDAGIVYRGHLADGPIEPDVTRQVDLLSYEAHTSVRQSSVAKALRAQGRPFEVGITNTLPSHVAGSWIGWWVKPSALLSLETAIVAAHGGTPYVGAMVYPDGALVPAEMQVLGETGAWLEARREWLHGHAPVVDAAVLHQHYGLGLKRDTPMPYHPPEQPFPEPLPEQPRRPFEPLPRPTLCNGLEIVLRDHHVQYQILHEDQSLDGHRLLVFQGDTIVSPELAERVRHFVHQGGALLVEYHGGLLGEGRVRRADFLFADVLGVRFAGYAGSWDANYLRLDDVRLRAGLPDFPLMVVGPAVRVELAGATPLATVVQPLGGYRTRLRHTASRFNPPGAATDAAGVTWHRYGAGQAVYVACALGDHVSARHEVDPLAKRFGANLVDLLLPNPLLRTNAPSGVELLLNRRPGGYTLHAFNHYLAAGGGDGRRDAPAVAGVHVVLDERRLLRIGRARLVPEGKCLEVRRADGMAALDLPAFAIACTVALDLERTL